MLKVRKNLAGCYGNWLDTLLSSKPKTYSLLHPKWNDIQAWKEEAIKLFLQFVNPPNYSVQTEVETLETYVYDGLEIEKLEWQLPYGKKTQAFFLKPEKIGGKLPGILALHDHGGNKYFGKSKITRVTDAIHPFLERYQQLYYGGRGWANELARRGYGVLVHDVFPFESRKISPDDLPGYAVTRMMLHPHEVKEVTLNDLESTTPCTAYNVSLSEPKQEIDLYNAFAGQHEHVLAKSLFCSGLTWPGVCLAEDKFALDYLASRSDIDPARIGCGGLSGGGLRTNYLAGTDKRIRCSVTVGFMSTWRDFALATAYTHTWMIYIPILPNYMDYPDILAMRVPLPTLVISTRHDPLFTFDEVKSAEHILIESFKKAKKPECFKMVYYDGQHKFDAPMQAEAFAWFDRWLN
ncbi:MAG: prolyl oligopeptidase family serine peptidase [Spirochaetota bacterium]